MPMLVEMCRSTPEILTGAFSDSMTRCATLSASAPIGRGAQHQHEFVATDAGDGVDRGDDALQASRDVVQQFIAGAMAQRIVDELEAVEIEHQHGELLLVAFRMDDRLVQPIVEQHAIGQAGQRVVRGQVAKLVIGRFQSHGAHRHHVFEGLHLAAHELLALPLARERARALQDFDGLEGLLQHQQFVRVAEALGEIGPVVVGVRRADHDLDVRIRGPQMLDGLEAVPAREACACR